VLVVFESGDFGKKLGLDKVMRVASWRQ
jgi:hypothetical protein